jgi:hypothetical protein
MAFSLILVLTNQVFGLNELIETLVNVSALFYVQLKLNEGFLSCTDIVHVLSFHIASHFPLKHPTIRSLCWCSFHAVLQCVAKNAVEFLDIVLHIHLLITPAETLQQLSRADRLVFYL